MSSSISPIVPNAETIYTVPTLYEFREASIGGIRLGTVDASLRADIIQRPRCWYRQYLGMEIRHMTTVTADYSETRLARNRTMDNPCQRIYVYIYQGYSVGVHLPKLVPLQIIGMEFTYDECPELSFYLDHTEFTIERWMPAGHFAVIDPFKKIRYDPRSDPFIVFRAGGQPDDYLKNCKGFRELSYEMFFAKSAYGWVPIGKGLTPPDANRILAEMGGTGLMHVRRELRSGNKITLKKEPGTHVFDFDDIPTAKKQGPWVWKE